MPRLPQYISQAQPHGIVRGVMPDAPRVGGLVAGITGAANAVQRGADIREEQIAQRMEHERQRIATEEAQAAVSRISSDMRMRYTERLNERQQSGEPLAGMTEGMLKEFAADAEKQIASAPENARPHLIGRLEALKTHVHERAFEAESNSRRAGVITDFVTSREADSRTLQADPSQFNHILSNAVASANSLTLDPQTKTKLVGDTRSALAYSAAGGIVDRTPDAFLAMSGMAGGKTGKDGKPLPVDPAKAAEAVANNPLLSNLKPEQLHALTERATMLSVNRKMQAEAEQERIRARAEAAANKAEREAERAFSIFTAMQQDGRVIDMTNPENQLLAKQMQAVPAYAKAFTAMATQAPANAAAAVMPLSEQEARLNALYAQRNVHGTSQALDAEIKRSETVLKSATEAYRADPLKAAADRGVIPALAPLDMSTPEAMVPGLAMRVQQADLTAQKVGRFVSPFTADEARKFSDDLAKMPTAEKERRLGMLAQTIGTERMIPTMAQIGKDNIRLAVAGAMVGSMTTDGKSVARNVLEGDAILKAKQFELPDRTELLKRFAAQVGNAIPTLEGKEAAMKTAEAIYAKLRADSGATSDKALDSTAWASAVAQVTGGVVNHHGQKLLGIRYGATEQQSKEALRSVNAAQVGSWGGVAGMTDAEAAEFIKEARLESVSIGRYRVMAGSSILQRKDGAPFEMVFR